MLWFFESFFPVVWIAFLIYWRIKAAGTKTIQRSEPALLGIQRALAFLVVIVLLSTTRIPLPWLYRRLWPSGIWPFWIGAAVTVVGLLFAVWARQHLASDWSSAVTIKQGHELITTGPYVLVRHPIYTGILTGFLGTAIALSRVRGVIGFVLIFAVLWAKLRMEEKWMRSQFGETYSAYAHQTAAPGAVPFLIAMCHEPPHARNGSSQLRSTSYQSAQAAFCTGPRWRPAPFADASIVLRCSRRPKVRTWPLEPPSLDVWDTRV